MEHPFKILVKQDKHVILRKCQFSAYNCNTSGDISRDHNTKISNISEDIVCEIRHLCYYFMTFQLETPLHTFIYCSSFQWDFPRNLVKYFINVIVGMSSLITWLYIFFLHLDNSHSQIAIQGKFKLLAKFYSLISPFWFSSTFVPIELQEAMPSTQVNLLRENVWFSFSLQCQKTWWPCPPQ